MADIFKVTTWEEAAFEAASDIFDEWYRLSLDDDSNNLELLRELQDDLNAMFLGWNDEDFLLTAQAMGGVALRHLFENGHKSDNVLHSIVTLVCSKQRDYGPENILAFRERGLIVRLSDKVARLENLTKRGDVAANESVHDTWCDVIGYSIVALMLAEGTFELPLAADLEPQSDPAFDAEDYGYPISASEVF